MKPAPYYFAKLQKCRWPCELVDPAKYTPEMKAAIARKRSGSFIKIVKFFDEVEFHVVTKETDLTPYESDKKEELIRKGDAHLKKTEPSQVAKFKSDIISMETSLGTRSSSLSSVWYDKITTEAADSTPKKQSEVVKNLFQKPPEVVTPEKRPPPVLYFGASASPKKKVKVSVEKTVQRQSQDQSSSSRRYACERCGVGFDRLDNLTFHRRNCNVNIDVKKTSATPTRRVGVSVATRKSKSPSPNMKKASVTPKKKLELLEKKKKIEENILKDWDDEDEKEEDDEFEDDEKMPELRIFETTGSGSRNLGLGSSGGLERRPMDDEDLDQQTEGEKKRKRQLLSGVALFDRLVEAKNCSEGSEKVVEMDIDTTEPVSEETETTPIMDISTETDVLPVINETIETKAEPIIMETIEAASVTFEADKPSVNIETDVAMLLMETTMSPLTAIMEKALPPAAMKTAAPVAKKRDILGNMEKAVPVPVTVDNAESILVTMEKLEPVPQIMEKVVTVKVMEKSVPVKVTLEKAVPTPITMETLVAPATMEAALPIARKTAAPAPVARKPPTPVIKKTAVRGARKKSIPVAIETALPLPQPQGTMETDEVIAGQANMETETAMPLTIQTTTNPMETSMPFSIQTTTTPIETIFVSEPLEPPHPIAIPSASTSSIPTLTSKPTATIKPQQVTMESILNQQDTTKVHELTTPLIETDAVVHLVPVENQDGTITYMLLSLGQGNELRVNVAHTGAPAEGKDLSTLEALIIDKQIDLATVIASIGQPSSSSSSHKETPVSTVTTSCTQQPGNANTSQIEGESTTLQGQNNVATTTESPTTTQYLLM